MGEGGGAARSRWQDAADRLRAEFPEKAEAVERYLATDRFRSFEPEQKVQAIEILRGALSEAKSRGAPAEGTDRRTSRDRPQRRRRKKSRR